MCLKGGRLSFAPAASTTWLAEGKRYKTENGGTHFCQEQNSPPLYLGSAGDSHNSAATVHFILL